MEVFECHNKTVTRQTSLQRKSRRLSGKLHCLNFLFPTENETLGPVCLGCEASLSCVSLSMLKVPISMGKTTVRSLCFTLTSLKSWIQVINKIGRLHSGSLICLITSMITDQTGWHKVLLYQDTSFRFLNNPIHLLCIHISTRRYIKLVIVDTTFAPALYIVGQ